MLKGEFDFDTLIQLNTFLATFPQHHLFWNQKDLQPFSTRYEDFDTLMENNLKTILKNSKLIKGPTKRYILNTTRITEGKLLRKERIGEKDDKPRKIILMVGETGTGKTTLINTLVNYIMGVRWEHKMWLEVVEISEEQSESQTTAVTVYEFFSQDNPFSLTVIDTPGFGDTEHFMLDNKKDTQITEALQQLFRSEDGIHEIHAVCLVLKATDVRLHERQRYILDEILSLFGKDIEKHIVLLFTHSSKKKLSKKNLNLIKESGIKCAKDKDGEYICFHFDNCQSESFDEEDRESYKSSWERGIENVKQFFDYLKEIHPISLNMTEGVLRARKQLNASVNNLKDRIQWAELKQKELEQTQTAVREFENYREEQKNFQYEVDEPYKDLVMIDSPWWHLSKQATRCTECKENCHYPGCWWVKDLSWCSVMTEGKCTVCSGKCDHTEHVKDDQLYEIKTRKVIKTHKDLKEKYEKEFAEQQSLLCRLENEIKQIEREKIRLVEECYQCLEKLMETALKSTSMSCFKHLDFMIEKINETGNKERVQKLEELKLRAEAENTGLIRFYKHCKINF